MLYVRWWRMLKIYNLISKIIDNYTEYICITSKYTINKKYSILKKCYNYREKLKKTIA